MTGDSQTNKSSAMNDSMVFLFNRYQIIAFCRFARYKK